MKTFIFCILLFYLINLKSSSANNTPLGALLEVKFSSKVGYNLDEIPEYSIKDVKKYIKSIKIDDWMKRAHKQITASIYRQVCRVYYFSPNLQLTIPPEEVWQIKFNGEPYEEVNQGHPYISRNYTFYSVVIGRADSINASEPLLNAIGGVFSDVFKLPVDPEHVFQRSGYACVDEAAYSLDTVTSENVLGYYDQECGVEPYTPIENRTYAMNQGSY